MSYLISAHYRSKTTIETKRDIQRISDRWHRDINFFQGYEVILVPANISNQHWVWLAVYPGLKQIHCFDGFRQSYKHIFFDKLLNWLEFESQKVDTPFNRKEWEFKDINNGPCQRDHYNCGIIMLKGIEYTLDNLPLSFNSSSHLVLFRRKMLRDIMAGYIQHDDIALNVRDVNHAEVRTIDLTYDFEVNRDEEEREQWMLAVQHSNEAYLLENDGRVSEDYDLQLAIKNSLSQVF